MSDNPTIPISEAGSPFIPATTPNIERANRLLGLRSHPGFLDLLRLSQTLVQDAADTCADFGGWDSQQIIVLKVRMQAAKEMHQALITRMQNAIQAGLDEAKATLPTMPAMTATEMMDQGDLVRQHVLQNFETMDADQRSPGSY
jgi:hypothetical protein